MDNKNTQNILNKVWQTYDTSGLYFLKNKKNFSSLLQKKWLSQIEIKNNKIVININSNLVSRYNLTSLGYDLSTMAVYKKILSVVHLEKTNLLWYIPGIEFEERITIEQLKYKWDNNHPVRCYDRFIALTKLQHFINEFKCIDSICKEHSNILFWYTDDYRLQTLLNTKFLHKHYLNNNTFYKHNKLLDLSNFDPDKRQETIIKMWLQRCSH